MPAGRAKGLVPGAGGGGRIGCGVGVGEVGEEEGDDLRGDGAEVAVAADAGDPLESGGGGDGVGGVGVEGGAGGDAGGLGCWLECLLMAGSKRA